MVRELDWSIKRLSMTLVRGLLALFALCEFCPLVVAAHVPDPIFEEVIIKKPIASDVWLAGSKHTVICEFDDRDCNLETGDLDRDEVICTWDGASGDFPNGNVGKSVDYVCIDIESLDWVFVSATDAGYLADDDREPSTRGMSFWAIIPEIVEVNFQLESEAYNLRRHTDKEVVSSSGVAEYEREFGATEPTKNHSAVFRKNAPLSLKFKAQHEKQLTEGTGDIAVGVRYRQDPQDQWTTMEGQGFGTGTLAYASPVLTATTNCFGDYISYEPEFENRGIYFDYAVITGSGNWIQMPPLTRHPLCVVANTPTLRLNSDAPHYEWIARASCRMAHGQASDEPTTIVNDLFDSLPAYASAYHEPESDENTWKHWEPEDWDANAKELKFKSDAEPTGLARTLVKYEAGRCGDWCSYLLALCNVQGIDGTHGLKDGRWLILRQPWQGFRVEYYGTNHSEHPITPADKWILDEGKYPDLTDDNIHEHRKQWWDFLDHGAVFLDVEGDEDSLYDPSFAGPGPENGGKTPHTVAWPGPNKEEIAYTKRSDFMAKYFLTTAPYLYYGWYFFDDPDDIFALHVHTADDGCFPVKFEWDPGNAGEEGRWW